MKLPERDSRLLRKKIDQWQLMPIEALENILSKKKLEFGESLESSVKREKVTKLIELKNSLQEEIKRIIGNKKQSPITKMYYCLSGEYQHIKEDKEVELLREKLKNVEGQINQIGKKYYYIRDNESEIIKKELEWIEFLIQEKRNINEKRNKAELEEKKRIEIEEEERQKKIIHTEAIIAAATGRTRKAGNKVKIILKNQIDKFPNCPYCDEPLGNNAHCDHIHPVFHGGLSTINNMVYICSSCNLKKGDLTLREFILKLKLNREKVEENLIKMGKRV